MNSTNAKLASALLKGKSRKIGHTRVIEGQMFYGDNLIVSMPHPNVLRVSMASYRSQSTADKINAVLETAEIPSRISKYGYVQTNGVHQFTSDRSDWLVFGIPEKIEP